MFAPHNHVATVGRDPDNAHHDETRFVKHDCIGQPRCRASEHHAPAPPFASADEPHAGDADKLETEQHPCPRCFVMHGFSIARDKQPKPLILWHNGIYGNGNSDNRQD